MAARSSIPVVLCMALLMCCANPLASTAQAAISARSHQVQSLLDIAEQTYLFPNGLSLDNFDLARPTHLENLSILLGLVLRGQYWQTGNDQTLLDAFNELQGQTMIFLAETARNYGHHDDPERFWRGFAVLAMEGRCDDFVRRVFHVDPLSAVVPLVLRDGEAGLGDVSPRTGDVEAPPGPGESVSLLNNTANPNEIDPYGRSEPPGMAADDLVGTWSEYGNKGAQLQVTRTGEGTYEGRLLTMGRDPGLAGGWQSCRYLFAAASVRQAGQMNMGSQSSVTFQTEIVYVDYQRTPSTLDAFNGKMPPVVEHRKRMTMNMARTAEGLVIGADPMRVPAGFRLPTHWVKGP